MAPTLPPGFEPLPDDFKPVEASGAPTLPPGFKPVAAAPPAPSIAGPLGDSLKSFPPATPAPPTYEPDPDAQQLEFGGPPTVPGMEKLGGVPPGPARPPVAIPNPEPSKAERAMGATMGTPRSPGTAIGPPSEFGKGLASGQQMFGSSMQFLGALSGADPLRKWGESIATASPEDRKKWAPRIESIDKIKSAGDAMDWLSFTLGNLIPSMGASVAGGAAGGASGAAVGGPVGAVVGGVAGAAGVSYLLNGGEVYASLIEQGVPVDRARKAAAAAGVPMALLDVIVPVKVAGKLIWQPVKKEAGKQLAKSVGKEILKDVAEEGLTEGLQEGIGAFTEHRQTGKPLLTPENASRILNSVAAGAAGGAFFGGVGEVGSRVRGKVERGALEQPPKPFGQMSDEELVGHAQAIEVGKPDNYEQQRQEIAAEAARRMQARQNEPAPGAMFQGRTGPIEVVSVENGMVRFNQTLADGNVLRNIRLPLEKFQQMARPVESRPTGPLPAEQPQAEPATLPVVAPEDQILEQAPPAAAAPPLPADFKPVEPQAPEQVPPAVPQQSTASATITPSEVVEPPAPGGAQQVDAEPRPASPVPAEAGPATPAPAAGEPAAAHPPEPAPAPAAVAPAGAWPGPAVPAVDTEKQPWELTQEEWFDHKWSQLPKKAQQSITAGAQGFVGVDAIRQQSNGEHRRNVEAAIAEGKPVPPGVLAGYPDLEVPPASPGEEAIQPKRADVEPAGAKGASPAAPQTISPTPETAAVTPQNPLAAPVVAGATRGGEGESVARPVAEEKPAPPGPIPSGTWMNDFDIDRAMSKFKSHPVLSRAVKFLSDLREEANNHSDGWHSWPLPSNAAAQLQGLVQHPEYATEANLKKALGPIRAFYTKRGTAAGMKWPSVEGIEPLGASAPASTKAAENIPKNIPAKKPTPKQRAEAEATRRRDLFQPGNVLKTPTGYEKVLAYEEGIDSFGTKDPGAWRVSVVTTDEAGNPKPNERQRNHQTPPDRGTKVVSRQEPAPTQVEEPATRVETSDEPLSSGRKNGKPEPEPAETKGPAIERRDVKRVEKNGGLEISISYHDPETGEYLGAGMNSPSAFWQTDKRPYISAIVANGQQRRRAELEEAIGADFEAYMAANAPENLRQLKDAVAAAKEGKRPATETKPAPTETKAPDTETSAPRPQRIEPEKDAAPPKQASEPATPPPSKVNEVEAKPEPKPATPKADPALANKAVARAVDDLIDASDRASRSTQSGSAMAEIEAERLRQRIRSAREVAGSPLAKDADPKQVKVLNRTVELAEKVLAELETAAAKPAPKAPAPAPTQEPAAAAATPASEPYQPGALGNYIDRLGGMRDNALVFARDLLGEKVDPTALENATSLLPDSVKARLNSLVGAHKAANPVPAPGGPLRPGSRVQINRHTGMGGRPEDFGVIENISTNGKSALVRLDDGTLTDAISLNDLSASTRPIPGPEQRPALAVGQNVTVNTPDGRVRQAVVTHPTLPGSAKDMVRVRFDDDGTERSVHWERVAPIGQSPSMEPGPRELNLGDIVRFEGKEYEVSFINPGGSMRLAIIGTSGSERIPGWIGRSSVEFVRTAADAKREADLELNTAVLETYRDSLDKVLTEAKLAEQNGWKPTALLVLQDQLLEMVASAESQYNEKRELAAPSVVRDLGRQLALARNRLDWIEGRLSQEEQATPEEVKQSGVNGFVQAVHETLSSGGTLGNVTELTKLAEEHFGSSRTSGSWSPKDMFDAMEAGINRYLVETGAGLLGMPFENAMQELRDLMSRVTSQGVRTDEQVKLQQFSTPPTESFVAAKVANIRPSDVVAETSAGNGGLAVWPKSIGAEVHVNEISERRQQMLKAVGFENITAHDGEIINALLDPSVKPTVVLMNPPFSAGGAKSGPAANNNQYGFNHVNAALQRLAPGGRLVAILGGGRADDANGGATLLGGPSGKWFTDLARRYNVRANVRIHGREYQKYGTSFATRIIVIDKTGPTPSRSGSAPNWDSVVRGNADTLEQAYNLLEGVANDRPSISTGAPGAVRTGEGDARGPQEPTGGRGADGERGVLPSGGRSPEAGTVGGQPGPGGRPGDGAGNAPVRPGEPTDLRQPGATGPGSVETPTSRAPEGGPANADFQRPIPGADDLAASAGMSADDLLSAIRQGLGDKMGKSPAPPPPRITKPRAPRAPKAPKAATPQQQGNALSGASDKAMADLQAWMQSQGGGDGPGTLQARGDEPKVNAAVPPQVLINLGVVGGEQMLNGATTFDSWSAAMNGKAGPIIEFVAQRGNSDPVTVLRQVYALASQVVGDYGVKPDPLPPATTQAEQKKLAEGPLQLERDTTQRPETEDSAAYVTYHPTLKGPQHPGDIVETKTMATVPLPEITYRPHLPKSVVEDGKLSAVQLEAIAIAGQQNEIILPGGFRASALIGDGTGVGKGRIAAGIMWDNYRQGRKRIVFVTEKWDLMQDIIRDLNGIGANELLRNVQRNRAGQWVTGTTSSVRPFNKWQAGSKIQHDGILFATYALIRSENNKGETRAAQLEQYLRGDDNGDGAVIVFDESHNLKNAVVGQGGQASQIGVAVKNLLQAIPALRTTSLSATAATDVMNLGYLDRLGLWGPGTAFPTGFSEFASQIAGGRLAAMEMVARELKAQGKYVSRTLSFKGVTYDEAEHKITPEQADLYRTATNAWRRVVNEAETSIRDTTNGGARQVSRFMAQFGAAQQRFFNILITALKTPTAVELAQKALADGKSVVITLVNTNEAAQNREKARAAVEGDEDEAPDFDFGPKQILVDLVREHYPVQQYADDVDDNGNPIKVAVTRPGPDGKPIAVNNPEAEDARDALIAEIERDLHMPENPLDSLINALGGPEQVAELTGRKERYDSSVNDFVPRGDPNAARKDVNLFEMRAFQEGKKRVAVLSTAAGTGISLHAGNDVPNQQKRYHITLQVGWSADKAMQMFGRTHRTNQVHAPEYVLLASDLGGEKRFISTISRRLGSLGALTKGQKDATSGTDLMDKVNFETQQGTAATRSFYEALLHDQPTLGALKMVKNAAGEWEMQPDPLTGKEVLAELRMLEGDPPTVPQRHRENVTRLLNRLLALDPETQNGVYNYFYDIFSATVQRAIETNTLDTGVKTLPGDTFEVKEQRPIAKDPETGAETFYYKVDANVRNKRMSVKDLERRMAAAADDANPQILRRDDTGKLAYAVKANPIVHASGSLEEAFYVSTPENSSQRKVGINNMRNRVKPVEQWAREELATAKRELGYIDLKWREQRYEDAKRFYPKTLQERISSLGYRIQNAYGPMRDSLQRDLATAQSKLAAFEETGDLPPDNYERTDLEEARAKAENLRIRVAVAEEAAADPIEWAKREWERQYDDAPSHTTNEHHLIGGAVMRYWNPIREASQLSNIYTTTDSKNGQRVVGVDIPAERIGQLLGRITGGASTVTPSQLRTDVLRNNLTYTLEGGIQVRRGTIARQPVIQLIPAAAGQGDALRALGVLYERGVMPVFYVPNQDTGPYEQRTGAVLTRVLNQYPVQQNTPGPNGPGGGGPAPLQSRPRESGSGAYRMAGKVVDGLTVRSQVPNMDSIAATLNDYEVLPGIREVPMSAFDAPNTYSADDQRRVRELAQRIESSGEINPLIVVEDAEGLYVLEGGHRLAALDRLGKKSLPAVVVLDTESLEGGGALESRGRARQQSATSDSIPTLREAPEASSDFPSLAEIKAYWDGAVAQPRTIEGQPVLFVNGAAMDIILARMGATGAGLDSTKTYGLAMRPNEWVEVLDESRVAARTPRPGGFDEALARIGAQMEDVLRLNEPGPGRTLQPLVVVQSGVGLNETPRVVLEEELDHAKQLRLSPGVNLKGMPVEMLDSPAGQKAVAALGRQGYRVPQPGSRFYEQNRAIMAAEVGARLMRGGRYAELGLTPSEAVDLVKAYVKGLERHGDKANEIIDQTERALNEYQTTLQGRPADRDSQYQAGGRDSAQRGREGTRELPPDAESTGPEPIAGFARNLVDRFRRPPAPPPAKAEWIADIERNLGPRRVPVATETATPAPPRPVQPPAPPPVVAEEPAPPPIAPEPMEEAFEPRFEPRFEPPAPPVTPQDDYLQRPAGPVPNASGPREPQIMPSRVAARVAENAVAARLTERFEGLPTYEKMNVAEQTRRATELVNQDPARAARIAMGRELPPAGILPESVFAAVEQQAIAAGDVSTLRALATSSTISLEATGMGQRIRMLAERPPNSPVEAIKKVAEARKAAATKRHGPKAVAKIRIEIKTDINRQHKNPKTWMEFISNLTCK